jgi:hypothetical protein
MLDVESKYGVGEYGATLRACVDYLRQHGMDVDEETARLAIQIYTERNAACHAEVGNPDIAGNSRALAEAIDRDIEMLSQVLPEDQVPNRKNLERLMHFYRDSASWLAKKDHDRLEDHRESRTPRLPPPEDSSTGPTRHGNESPDKIRSVSPRKRTVSGSAKAHQPSTSSEGLHAFNGILEDIAVLRSRGGNKAIQAVQEASSGSDGAPC